MLGPDNPGTSASSGRHLGASFIDCSKQATMQSLKDPSSPSEGTLSSLDTESPVSARLSLLAEVLHQPHSHVREMESWKHDLFHLETQTCHLQDQA